MRRLKKILQLSPSQLWVLMQAVIGLPLVRLALHFNSVTQVSRSPIERATNPSLQHGLIKAEEIARLVRVAAQHGICQATCLEQSVLLRRLLARRGIDGQIIFGTRKAEGETQAHAWVEVEGVPLDGGDQVHAHFKPFDSPRDS
jgi:Transglutaminase-like superfamily